MPHKNAGPKFDAALSYLNAGFTFLFVGEALTKVVAMGPRLYVGVSRETKHS